MNDYVIAIPSYKRNETLKKKTMRVLSEYKINPNKIYIFVADNDQKKLYEDTLEPKTYNKIVVGKPGIQHIRNFMPKYFPEKKPALPVLWVVIPGGAEEEYFPFGEIVKLTN